MAVKPITLGVVDGERAAVTAGLAAGDIVVTEGGDRLRDGATVLLPSAPGTPATAAPAGRKPPGPPGANGQHKHSRNAPPPAQ